MVKKEIVKKIIKNTKNLYYNEIKRFDNRYYKPDKKKTIKLKGNRELSPNESLVQFSKDYK